MEENKEGLASLKTPIYVLFGYFRFDKSRVPVTWLDVEGGDDGTATPDEVIDHRGIYRGKPV